MKATGENVIMTHILESIKTKSGLDLSNELVHEQKYYRANVIAVGDKVQNIEVGDVVWYDITRSTRVMIDGNELTLINYQNIGIIE